LRSRTGKSSINNGDFQDLGIRILLVSYLLSLSVFIIRFDEIKKAGIDRVIVNSYFDHNLINYGYRSNLRGNVWSKGGR
jgi:hypothetical protein